MIEMAKRKKHKPVPPNVPKAGYKPGKRYGNGGKKK